MNATHNDNNKRYSRLDIEELKFQTTESKGKNPKKLLERKIYSPPFEYG